MVAHVGRNQWRVWIGIAGAFGPEHAVEAGRMPSDPVFNAICELLLRMMLETSRLLRENSVLRPLAPMR